MHKRVRRGHEVVSTDAEGPRSGAAALSHGLARRSAITVDACVTRVSANTPRAPITIR